MEYEREREEWSSDLRWSNASFKNYIDSSFVRPREE